MPTVTIRVIGSYLSPYVRKVLACLEIKGIAYEIDPIVPFFGNDEFARLSPLRRIPVLIDGGTALSYSTVICEYLNEKYPQISLLPESPEARSRARWFEEYADSRLGEVFVWGAAPDHTVLEKAQREEIPQILDYLEGVLPEVGFLFASLSIADIALASFFRNAAFVRFEVDATRWPRTAGYVSRVLATDGFMRIRQYEELCIRTALPEHRSALLAAGAPIAGTTLGTDTPRPGFFTV
jgi:glutathione S-transferase